MIYECSECYREIDGEIYSINGDEPCCQDCLDHAISDAEYRAEAYIQDQAESAGAH